MRNKSTQTCTSVYHTNIGQLVGKIWATKWSTSLHLLLITRPWNISHPFKVDDVNFTLVLVFNQLVRCVFVIDVYIKCKPVYCMNLFNDLHYHHCLCTIVQIDNNAIKLKHCAKLQLNWRTLIVLITYTVL